MSASLRDRNRASGAASAAAVSVLSSLDPSQFLAVSVIDRPIQSCLKPARATAALLGHAEATGTLHHLPATPSHRLSSTSSRCHPGPAAMNHRAPWPAERHHVALRRKARARALPTTHRTHFRGLQQDTACHTAPTRDLGNGVLPVTVLRMVAVRGAGCRPYSAISLG